MDALLAVVEAQGAVELEGRRGLVGLAELWLAGAADAAVAAVGDEGEDAAVAGLDGSDALAGLDDRAAGLVSEDERERHPGGADHEVVVAGAEAGGAHLDQHLAGPGRLLVKLTHVERLMRLIEYGGFQLDAPFNAMSPKMRRARSGAGASLYRGV